MSGSLKSSQARELEELQSELRENRRRMEAVSGGPSDETTEQRRRLPWDEESKEAEIMRGRQQRLEKIREERQYTGESEEEGGHSDGHEEGGPSVQLRSSQEEEGYDGLYEQSQEASHLGGVSSEERRSAEDRIPQIKFYKRAKKQEEYYKLLQDTIAEEAAKMANKQKLSEKSYKLIIRRLESTLTMFIAEIDKEKRRRLSFEQLGRLYTLLSIFKVISYNEECKLDCPELFYSEKARDQQRRYDEMLLHEQTWARLTNGRPMAPEVNVELVYAFFRVMLDPATLTLEELAYITDDYVRRFHEREEAEDEGHREEGHGEERMESWSTLQLVRHFRKVNENRLAYVKTGMHKPEKADAIKKNSQYTFRPFVNPISQYLGAQHRIKFLQTIPLDGKAKGSGHGEQGEQRVMKVDIGKYIAKGHGVPEEIPEAPEEESFLRGTGTQSMQGSGLTFDERLAILMKKRERTEMWRREQQRAREAVEMSQCTFKPSLNKTGKVNETVRPNQENIFNRLYTANPVKRREEEHIAAQLEREGKELDQCTFHPQVNGGRPRLYPEETTPKGYDKVVERLRYANEEAQRKKEQRERVPLGENYERLRAEKVKPFSFLGDKGSKKAAAFLYIDINVGNGKTGRVGLHEGDDPRVLAKNFARAFQLNKEMQKGLEDLISFQLQEYYRMKTGGGGEQ
eukprot:TRINITY_DN1886_c0_g1_i2.p1 TRINITY_DN1886_c0_g1~~TRINITY_DN1886_c0_g1_i2.p1  ORF type:complete len:685 (-),score=193.71 TRINITY_DN1886_c0_g1_i2:1634-3688(-)